MHSKWPKNFYKACFQNGTVIAYNDQHGFNDIDEIEWVFFDNSVAKISIDLPIFNLGSTVSLSLHDWIDYCFLQGNAPDWWFELFSPQNQGKNIIHLVGKASWKKREVGKSNMELKRINLKSSKVRSSKS